MVTAAQRRRLLEGIAFITSHRKQWKQGYWVAPDSVGSCGTVGCLAGHIAITLNSSQPIVKVPAKVWKKKPSQRTREEHVLVDNAASYAELLTPVKADHPDAVVERLIAGKFVSTIHVRERAARLIGVYSRELFRGSNKLNDIYLIAAYELGITVAELKKECAEIAQQRGWTKTRG